ncbi:MAG: hypothetical protein ACI9QN_002051 [Arcticibacterium sp.]|jgi:hypothetical protein
MRCFFVQEDINYPIEVGFESRRTAFARYLEAVLFWEIILIR